jgi:hypothetical protein
MDSKHNSHIDALLLQDVLDSPDEVRKKVIQNLNSRMTSPCQWQMLMSYMEMFFQWINQSKIRSTPIHEVVLWLYKRLINNMEAYRTQLPFPWKRLADPYGEICKTYCGEQAAVRNKSFLCEETFSLFLCFIEQGIYKYFKDDGERLDMEVPNCMYDIAEEFGLTSNEKQMIAFTTICSSFLLRVLDKGFVKTLFLGGTREDELKKKLAVTRGALKRLGAKEDLVLLLITVAENTSADSCKSPLIVAARKFCHQLNQTAKVLFDGSISFDTAHIQIDDIPAADNSTDKVNLITSQVQNEDWDNIVILFVDEMASTSTTRLQELDLHLRRVRNKPYDIYGGLCIVFDGNPDGIESVRKYTSSFTFTP